jgi:hypothetical protein
MERVVHERERGAARDPRWGGRIPCHAQVQITDDAELRGRGQMRDVSKSGAFIVTSLGVSLYCQLEVAIMNPDGSRGPCGHATVVRTDWDGIGIEWREIAEELTCPAMGCTTRCLAPGSPAQGKAKDPGS